MYHVVSLSGGIASAIAADRVIKRYGRDAVTLWFADTSWEDPDLYRFLDDCMERWGGELIRHVDGRTPLEVAEDLKFIPNQKRAPCTRVLKIEPFTRFITGTFRPVTVHLGLDWTEMHRMEAPRRNYEAIDGVTVDYPLMWKPYEFRNYFDIVRLEWGIDTPELYRLGFPHNNCGGRCFRQGVAQWLRLKKVYPERFAEVRDKEQEWRSIGDARKNYAIARDQSGGTVKPLTLEEIEKRNEPDESQPVQDDMFGCFCSY